MLSICVKYIAKTTFKLIGDGEVLQRGGGAGPLFSKSKVSKHDESFVAVTLIK